MEPAGIDGAWIFTPRSFHDARATSSNGSGPGNSPGNWDLPGA